VRRFGIVVLIAGIVITVAVGMAVGVVAGNRTTSRLPVPGTPCTNGSGTGVWAPAGPTGQERRCR
jgi:hypothetical protein